MLTSLSNGQLKNIQQLLKKSKDRREAGLFVVEGRKMFYEALELGIVKKAYFSETFFNSVGDVDCDYETVQDDIFDKIAETVTPQGVLALVKIPERDINKELSDAKGVVVLENLQDPGNLGTIVRTAEAAGIDAVVLSRDSVDIYNPKVVRSTMGAIFRLPIFYVEDILSFVSELNDKGFNTIATHLKASISYCEADYSGKTAVLVGNEGNGLTEEITELAKEKVIIPMEGRAESLNASVAAALMMYEIKRNKILLH